jgi:hypothetical protein
MRFPSALFAVAFLASCATPYAPKSLPGGYSEIQLDRNVFRVTFEGNGYTSRSNVEEMALLRSAEVALQNGFTHFVIAGGSSDSKHALLPMPGQSITTGSVAPAGNTAYFRSTTTTTGGAPLLVSFPTVVQTVVCFVGRPSVDALVYDATFLVSSLKPKHAPVK